MYRKGEEEEYTLILRIKNTILPIFLKLLIGCPEFFRNKFATCQKERKSLAQEVRQKSDISEC